MENAGFQELEIICNALAVTLLAAMLVMAGLARRLIRRRNVVSENELEVRAWSYCARCGWPRGRQETVDQTIDTYLPSALLRQGWCREPALDAEGRIVLPGDSAAVAWSLWGAGNHAFDPGSLQWQAWIEHLDTVLRARFGDTIDDRPMTVQRWNKASSRTRKSAINLAMEVEHLMGLATSGSPSRI